MGNHVNTNCGEVKNCLEKCTGKNTIEISNLKNNELLKTKSLEKTLEEKENKVPANISESFQYFRQLNKINEQKQSSEKSEMSDNSPFQLNLNKMNSVQSTPITTFNRDYIKNNQNSSNKNHSHNFQTSFNKIIKNNETMKKLFIKQKKSIAEYISKDIALNGVVFDCIYHDFLNNKNLFKTNTNFMIEYNQTESPEILKTERDILPVELTTEQFEIAKEALINTLPFLDSTSINILKEIECSYIFKDKCILTNLNFDTEFILVIIEGSLSYFKNEKQIKIYKKGEIFGNYGSMKELKKPKFSPSPQITDKKILNFPTNKNIQLNQQKITNIKKQSSIKSGLNNNNISEFHIKWKITFHSEILSGNNLNNKEIPTLNLPIGILIQGENLTNILKFKSMNFQAKLNLVNQFPYIKYLNEDIKQQISQILTVKDFKTSELLASSKQILENFIYIISGSLLLISFPLTSNSQISKLEKKSKFSVTNNIKIELNNSNIINSNNSNRKESQDFNIYEILKEVKSNPKRIIKVFKENSYINEENFIQKDKFYSTESNSILIALEGTKIATFTNENLNKIISEKFDFLENKKDSFKISIEPLAEKSNGYQQIITQSQSQNKIVSNNALPQNLQSINSLNHVNVTSNNPQTNSVSIPNIKKTRFTIESTQQKNIVKESCSFFHYKYILRSIFVLAIYNDNYLRTIFEKYEESDTEVFKQNEEKEKSLYDSYFQSEVSEVEKKNDKAMMHQLMKIKN